MLPKVSQVAGFKSVEEHELLEDFSFGGWRPWVGLFRGFHELRGFQGRLHLSSAN